MKKVSKKLIFSVISFVLAAVVIGTSIFTIAQNTQRNIAIDADVYVDTADWSKKHSNYSFYINNLGPKFLNDGSTSNANQFFSSPELSSPNATEVITMVFDGTYDVSKISLVPRGTTRNGIPEDFTLSVYNGSDWVVIDSKQGNTDIDITYTLNNVATTCTAVRLEATKLSRVLNTNNYSLQLAEFEVWGKKSDSKLAKPYILEDAENVAEGAGVDFDVPAWAQNDFPKTKITDGVVNEHKNFATTDALKENQKQEVYVTLDKVCKIDEISLYPAVQSVSGSLKYVGGFPVNYTLSVWNGSRWCEVGSEKDFSMSAYEAAANTVSAKKYKFDVIETNAIRLTVDKHSAVNTAGTQFALRLAEIMVNGLKTNKTDFNNPVYIKDYKDIELQKSDASDENNLIYTFDRTYAVKEVVLGGKEIASFPKQFSVSLWNGEEWQTIDKWDSFDIKNSKLYIAVDGINSRGIKIKSNDALTDLDLSKAELVVRANAVNTIVKPVAPVVNASLGATVETDIPLWAQNAGLLSSNLVDGKADTYITTAYSTSVDTQKTVTITLDGTYDIDTVNLYLRVKNGTVYGFPVDFTISAWDGTGWQIVKTITDEAVPESDSLKSYEFTAVSCSAIKIDVTKLGDSDSANEPYVLQLAELEALGIISDATIAPPGASGDTDNEGGNTPSAPTGDNAALNGTVSMQVPSWATNFKAENLVDGSVQTNVTTEFYSEQNTTESATVVFKDGAYDISTIMLYPRVVSGAYGGGFPVDFTVSTWDGTKWVKVYEKTDFVKDNANPFRIDLDTAILCNAVKVEATKLDKAYNDTKYTLQFAELEAYGEKSDSSITPPPTSGSQNGENDGGSDDTNTPEKPAGDNAALNGTVSMQVPSWATNFKAENLVDGSTVTAVSSEFYTEQNKAESISIVFKNGAYNIKTLMLYPRVAGGTVYGFPTDFTISAWDGSKWVEVNAKTGLAKNTAQPVTIELDTPIICNAIKIDVTKLGKSDNAGKPYTLQFAEIEAYGDKSNASIAAPSVDKGESNTNTETAVDKPDGENAALEGNATMEVPKWAENFQAKNLVDGSIAANSFATSEYYSEQKTKESASVVFKNGAYTIKSIMLYPRVKGDNIYGFPTDFTISAWNGKEWVEVHARTGLAKNTAQPVRIDLDTAVLCNAIKIDATKLGKADNEGKYTLQLTEIEAYGEKSSETLAAPSVSAGTDSGTGSVTLNNEGNLALNKPIKASSDLAQYNAPVTKANDGELSSYWASNDTKFVKGEPQWIEINLLNNYAVNKVVLGARQNALGFPYDFDIEVFYNGEWKKAYSVTGFEANEKAGYTAYEFTFSAVIGNKVRVSSANFRKVGSSNSMVLSEVAVYGDKVSGNYVLPNENMITSGVGITATSSMEDYDYYLAHLIDNSLTTAWSTVPSVEMTSQSVEVDMKCEVQLSEIQLKPGYMGYGFPIDFTISVYENGKWVDVYTAKDYKQPKDEAIQRFQFDKRNATKFRITATKLPMQAGLYVWKMNEIIAYPLHTGDEFDPNSTEITTSLKKNDAAKVVAVKGSEKLKVEISWWKIVAGAVLTVIAVLGCVAMLIILKKRKLKF